MPSLDKPFEWRQIWSQLVISENLQRLCDLGNVGVALALTWPIALLFCPGPCLRLVIAPKLARIGLILFSQALVLSNLGGAPKAAD